MNKTVHARALQRAAEILGGIDQLRIHLRVPRAQLLYWMEGGEKVPLDVFLKLVDVILEHSVPGAGTRRIRVGPNTARCPACDGIDFRPLVPDAPITYVSLMVCNNCAHQVSHGTLVVSAADDGARRSAAGLNRLKRGLGAQGKPVSDSEQDRPGEELEPKD